VPEFRALWLAQLASDTGDYAARLALGVLVYDRTGSAAWAGVVTAASFLPWVGIGQVLATLGDRLPRRNLMIAADVVRAGAFAAMAIAPLPPAGLVVLALLAGLMTPPFEAARSSLMADIFEGGDTGDDDLYGDAIAVAGVTDDLAVLGGFVLAGGLLAVASAEAALVSNALSFLLSGALLTRIRTGRSGGEPAERTSLQLIRAGARAVFADPFVRRAALLVAVPTAGAVAANAVVAAYSRVETGGAASVAVLALAFALGNTVTCLVIPRDGDHAALLHTAAKVSLVAAVVAACGFALGPGLPGAVIPFAAMGAMFGPIVPGNYIAGRRIAQATRASAFGLLQGMLLGAHAVGATLGGLIAAAVGPAPALAVAAGPGVAFAAWALLRPLPAAGVAPAGGSVPAAQPVA
jgi:hypothetical protein